MRTFTAILCLVALASLTCPSMALSTLGGPDLLFLPGEGSTEDLTITLESATAGLSGYNLSIALNPIGTAEIVAVAYPTWANMPMNSTMPATNTWIQAVDLAMGMEPGDTPVVLATITIRGIANGKAMLTVTPVIIDDDLGGRYTLDPLQVPVWIGVQNAEIIDTGDNFAECEASPSPTIEGMSETSTSSMLPTALETMEIVTTPPPPSPSISTATPAEEQNTPPAEATPGFDFGISCLTSLAVCTPLLMKIKRGE